MKRYLDSKIIGLVLADKSIIWWIFISSSFINVLLTPMLLCYKYLIEFLSVKASDFRYDRRNNFMFYSYQPLSYLRSKFIISLGMKLERKLNEPLFMAAFDEKLKANSNDPDAFLDDLTMFRQWLTNAAVFAVFDTRYQIHSYHVHTRPLFRIGCDNSCDYNFNSRI